MTERRNARRYNLSLPVFVHVPAERGAAFRNGRTRDISARGVHFTTDKDIPENAELNLMVTLPAEMKGGPEVFIRAMGKVMRVEKRSENGIPRVDVAAVIKSYEIVRNEDATA